MIPKTQGMLRLNQAVFKRASGNRWRTQARTQPSTLKSLKSMETGTKERRRKFWETTTKEREFALDILLETAAECRHIQIKKRIWYRARYSNMSEKFPEFAKEIGNHARIISRKTGTNENGHIGMGIIHVIFDASSHPSRTQFF